MSGEELPRDQAATAKLKRSSPRRPTREPDAPDRDVDHVTGARPTWRAVLASPLAVFVLIALAASLLAGGFTSYYEYTRPSVYQSSATLLIDQVPAIAASGDDGVLAKLSRLRFKYLGIATTEAFAAPVAQQAGLPVGVVHAALVPSADATSLLLTLSARTGIPTRSRLIAQVAAEQMVTYVQTEQVSAHIPAAQQVTFTIVSPAGPSARVAPNHKRAELVGVLVFLAVFVAALLAASLFRSERRH